MSDAKTRKVPHHEFYVAQVVKNPTVGPVLRLYSTVKNSAEGDKYIRTAGLRGYFCVVDVTVPPMLCETVDVPKTTVTPVEGGMAGVESMEPEGKEGKG